jgi:hypothetical protein
VPNGFPFIPEHNSFFKIFFIFPETAWLKEASNPLPGLGDDGPAAFRCGRELAARFDEASRLIDRKVLVA